MKHYKYKYPDLSDSEYIVFDFETRDPDLKTMGPSDYRGGGHIIGCGISSGKFSEYYNLGHPSEDHEDFDYAFFGRHAICEDTEETIQKNLEYVKECLALHIDKIGANIAYDYGKAKTAGMEVNGRLIDVQVAEALLNEYGHSYSLNAIAEKRLGEQKAVDGLQEYCDSRGWKGVPASHFWRMPSALLRTYGIQDVELPYKIWEKQKPEIEAEGMNDLFDMECALIKTMWKFRDNGIRIDTKQRDLNAQEIRDKMVELEKGPLKGVNVKSPKQVATLFDKFGITYPSTKKGNPSVTSPWLKNNFDLHPVINDVYMMRKCRTENSNFLEGAFVEFICPGDRLHCNFYLTKTEDNGTKSGRLAVAKPALQCVPGAKEPYFYKLSREIFLPEEGQLLIKIDYSQIEYRTLAHYAIGKGADVLKQSYVDNPYVDYHQFIMDMTGLPRPQAKTLNFGILYGMGVAKAADTLMLSFEEGREVVRQYHRKAPYIKETTGHIGDIGKRRGWLKTILGRRIHVPKGFDKVYSLANRLIQGTSADIMKKAIYDADQEGLYSVLTPHLTVHDELVMSMPMTKEGVHAVNRLKWVMENCVSLDVPIIADLEAGPNWYDIHEVDGPLTLEKAKELLHKRKD